MNVNTKCLQSQNKKEVALRIIVTNIVCFLVILQYYGLQILETVIKTRWKVLPRTQCEGIKKFIVGLIIKISSDSSAMEVSIIWTKRLGGGGGIRQFMQQWKFFRPSFNFFILKLQSYINSKTRKPFNNGVLKWYTRQSF